jgi:hypothetical protein
MSLSTETYECMTPQDIAVLATDFGATNPRIETDDHIVEVYVDLPTTACARLYKKLQEETPASITVHVDKKDHHNREENIKYEIDRDGGRVTLTEGGKVYANGYDVTDKYNGEIADMSTLYAVWSDLQQCKLVPRPLTEKETMRVMGTFDRQTLEADPRTDHIEVSRRDYEQVEDLVEEYGGLKPLLKAFQRSVVTSDDTLDAPNDETDSAPAQDDVEALKQAYVDGDIGILELERELEDAIELDYTPTATL